MNLKFEAHFDIKIKLELNDVYRTVNHFQHQILHLVRDLTKTLASNVYILLTRWLNQEFIINYIAYRKIYCWDGNLPRFYEVIKDINFTF